MLRYLSLCGFVLCGAIVGCQNSAIRAQAPGSEHPFTAQADSAGEYGLYHVTQFNNWGQPTEYKLLASYHLQSGDPLGFHWVIDKANINTPGNHMVLEAYAGDSKTELGPVTTMIEKYYWSNTATWDAHWREQPASAVISLAKMQ
jgi:hypothetical protein